MKHLLSAAVTSTLMTGTAFAGNIEPAPMEPVIAVATAPAPVFSSPNWTGFYAGGQLGYANIDTDTAGLDGDGLIGGLTTGYDYDLGNWVVGAGLDYDWTDVGLGNAPETKIDNIFRAKLRGGYKLGNGLLYATGGYALAETNNLSHEDGYFVGAGYEHLISENFSLGGEVLYHEFDGFNTTPNTKVEATTAQVRATFRF
ncbi:outer membrane protein [Roseovarius sp. D0-M9]|uniref:outer membrane protein n=1 Tax=Roseovarius sp. D0-M9 TaxID=3127117 RepID=UPI00300FE37A